MSANTIMLKGRFSREEAPAGEALKPGMFVELESDGVIVAHDTAGGVAEKAIVVEDALQGKTIYEGYAPGDPVQFNILCPGAVVQARISDGEEISVGDVLVSDGDGALQAWSSGGEYPLAVALAELDMSGSSGEDPYPLCNVRIL